MIRRPLAIPDLMLRIHGPNRSEIAQTISVAPRAATGLPSSVRFVFICFTNRCGSAYLGDLLSSTGFCAPADESLNAATALAQCRDHGLRSLPDYFAHVVRRDARNDTYIVKVAAEQIVLLVEAGILGQIVERSDFLFLHRTDKLAQAISRAIAEQNNRWTWDSPSQFPDDELVYSVERIAQHINDITILNMAFQQFFALNGILPIDVEYERLVSAPQREFDEMARRLGLPSLLVDPGKHLVRRQGNEINAAWRSRFLLEPAAPPGSLLGPMPAQVAVAVGVVRPETATPVSAVLADIAVHIRNIGDRGGACGSWIGASETGLWIEGFSITPHQGVAPSDIEYQGLQDFGQPLPWASGGAFSGTRGMTVPLRGLCVRLRNAAAALYQCRYSARFQDGSTVGPLQAGEVCRSTSLAPLVAFQIVIRSKSQ